MLQGSRIGHMKVHNICFKREMWFVDCYMEFKVTLFHGPFPWLLVACSILVVPVPVVANLIFF